jgi:uncharacterized protein
MPENFKRQHSTSTPTAAQRCGGAVNNSVLTCCRRVAMRFLKKQLLIGFVLTTLHGACAWAQEGPQALASVGLSAGMHLIQAEVAQTPDEHAVGLMFRSQLGPNSGMLFVFEQAREQCFWMKNTLIALSVAFVADNGRVVNIEEMQPKTLNSHCSSQPVRFVLEMNQGWFAKRGIKVDSKITGPFFKP